MTSDAAQTSAGAVTTGRCLCRAVRFAYEGPARWCGHCHCETCRRQCSAPFTTFVGVKDGRWRWTGVEPAIYHSSPWVERFFCSKCGSPMAYRGDHWPGEIHFYAASLDNPVAVEPRFHVHVTERLPWIHLDDGLPEYEGPAG